MAVFQELIKDFNKIRHYGRDFFIYGYRSRSDRQGKSKRSYDNEKRRLESFLPELIHWEMGPRGKRVFMKVNPEQYAFNPLYSLWETKTYTRNDCVLHFLILDLLRSEKRLMLTEIVDLMIERYHSVFEKAKQPDAMTVRNKLNEYVKAGLLKSEKEGKALIYSLKPTLEERLSSQTCMQLKNALLFFANEMPLGVLGYFLYRQGLVGADRSSESEWAEKVLFKFRHYFLFHTFDDGLLLEVLNCIGNRQAAVFISQSKRAGQTAKKTGVPLKVLTSARHGRRFVLIYNKEAKNYFILRLDRLEAVEVKHMIKTPLPMDVEEEIGRSSMWSIYVKRKEEKEQVAITLQVDEGREGYILERIIKEGKHGTLEKIEAHRFKYTVTVLDTQEIVPWLRTFTGRIVSIEGTNKSVIERFKKDMFLMAAQYEREEENGNAVHV